MRTMYIILAIAGWAWLPIAGTGLALAWRRRYRRGGGTPIGAEGEAVHDQ